MPKKIQRVRLAYDLSDVLDFVDENSDCINSDETLTLSGYL